MIDNYKFGEYYHFLIAALDLWSYPDLGALSLLTSASDRLRPQVTSQALLWALLRIFLS
jgi:hypothetical protein